MNNLKSTINFESSPLASSQAPNLNATPSMMGGRRRRHKRSKKGGMVEPETPEKDRGSRVAPIIEKVPLKDLIDDEYSIENANDSEYQELENQLVAENKIGEESFKIDIKDEEDEQKENAILDKLERGENIENSLDEKSGGTRRRTRKTKSKKTQKLSRKTKKTRKYKKSKKTKKSNKKK
jgi:hypothetical protein